MVNRILKYFLYLFAVIIELALFPMLVIAALVARLTPKSIDVGLGPEPLINNVYHKRALAIEGYTAETFVHEVYYITQEFDLRADRWLQRGGKSLALMALFVFCLFRYRILYFYFNGGPLGFTRILWIAEPFLLKLAGIKTVVMPYGSDVQDLLRCPNLLFRHVMSQQYPAMRWRRQLISRKIALWTCWGDHIIGGCDWVDYMYYWDTLVPAHFSIDLSQWEQTIKAVKKHPKAPLRILHAPNHRHIKGTQFFIDAVEQLRNEGHAVELILLEKVSNEEVRKRMASVDVVADQLIIGWYAMFALEAMAMGKPVLCYLRQDLLDLYRSAGVLDKGEHPIINCTPLTVKAVLRDLLEHPETLRETGRKGVAYVRKYHSIQAMGKVFAGINRSFLKKSKKSSC